MLPSCFMSQDSFFSMVLKILPGQHALLNSSKGQGSGLGEVILLYSSANNA